jgi:hypothetical protein
MNFVSWGYTLEISPKLTISPFLPASPTTFPASVHDIYQFPPTLLSKRTGPDPESDISDAAKTIIGLAIPCTLLLVAALITWLAYGREKVARLNGTIIAKIEETLAFGVLNKDVQELDLREVLELGGQEVRSELAGKPLKGVGTVYELDTCEGVAKTRNAEVVVER